MDDANQLLDDIKNGDTRAADRLLPLVYDELRRLASQKLANEAPGQTLDPTALVHEAYLRLLGQRNFNDSGHFFAAAAEAMRRILIERARAKRAKKRGGKGRRLELSDADRINLPLSDTLIDVNDALTQLAAEDAQAANVARLRLFAGLSVEQAGTALGLSRATAFRDWAYARAWIAAKLDEPDA